MASGPTGARRTGTGAVFAAIGIAASRLAGLVRERFLGQALGEDAAADALRAALRLPNFVQNLLGDTALSAAFTPVYAQLTGRGEQAAAEALRRLAATRLALFLSVLVVVGMAAAPGLVWLLAPGFDAERAALTTRLVRILFPATALLVMSALALAVLQARGRFLSGYASPVLWNGAIVACLLAAQAWHPDAPVAVLAEAVAWGAAVGALLQWVWQERRARTAPDVDDINGEGPLETARRAWKRCLSALPPVLASRGVVQISAWVDTALASLLPVGSLAVMAYAQTLYLLPIALFGTSISAAVLPALAAVGPGPGPHDRQGFKGIVERAARRMLVLGCLATGAGALFASSVVGLVYGGGRFDAGVIADTSIVLACGMTIVLPSMIGRLHASAFFALEQAAVATRAALLRVSVSVVLSALAVWLLDLPKASGPSACGWLLIASGVGALAEAMFLTTRLAQQTDARPRWLTALPCCLAGVAVGTGAGWYAEGLLAAGPASAAAALVAYGCGFVLTIALLGGREERSALVGVVSRLRPRR